MQLPPGLTARPLVLADAGELSALIAAQELCDLGEVEIELADIVGEWQRPSYDVSANAIGVFDGDRLVAYSEATGGDRGDAAVHPDYRGRGVGVELARWMQDRARAQGAAAIGMPVPTGSGGEALLRRLGYHPRWTSWLLRLPPGAEITGQPIAPGYSVREAQPSQYHLVWTLVEDAFLEWAQRARASFEDFSAEVFERPGFQPWNVRVVIGPLDEIVGSAHVVVNAEHGYLSRLAVARGHRNRGLARALLVDSFAVARDHGASICELTTDTRTGARGLYEKVGMVVAHEWVNYAIAL